MTTRESGNARRKPGRQEGGFTLIEVLLAIVILLVGVVAVAQLVPASIGSNSTNRNDSSALVFAQRQMDLFLSQPLNVSVSPPSFTETIDGQTFTCNLGDPSQPNVLVGSPVVIFYKQTVIDFTATPVADYSFTYQDPNDPSGVVYDVRWAIITTTNGNVPNGMISSKRFILGARKQGGNGIYKPVTLDTMLER